MHPKIPTQRDRVAMWRMWRVIPGLPQSYFIVYIFIVFNAYAGSYTLLAI